MNLKIQRDVSRRTSWKNTWIAAPMLIAAIGLTACSAGGTASSANTQTPASAPAAQSAAPTATTAAATTAAAITATEAPADAPADPAVTKLNLNTATADDFLTIPGMGNRMVREFEEYRPYVSIQQFRREIGKYVDEAQVAEYEKYVFVPVSRTEADAETLQQLPGVNASVAETLIVGRPYASNAAFLEKLGASISADDAAAAAAYLAAE